CLQTKLNRRKDERGDSPRDAAACRRTITKTSDNNKRGGPAGDGFEQSRRCRDGGLTSRSSSSRSSGPSTNSGGNASTNIRGNSSTNNPDNSSTALPSRDSARPL